MASDGDKSLSHREWRRIVKKERRRKIRRKLAREREADDDRLRETLERSADYLKWIEEQEREEMEKERREKEEHDERERLWLEAEVKAQKEWRELQERRMKARAEQQRQEEIIRKEFEEKQEVLKKKKEEVKRRQDEELKYHENIEKQIDSYIDDGAKTPESLRITTDSQPGKELCPFFTKTAACKYGDSCSRNHRRNALGKILIIRGFYSHFSLEKNSAEYDTDISLEFESSETQRHFREFYKDVLPELKTFGRIKTLRCCCNTEIHLRGNFYIEYYTEREAARAWRALKGRWYAGRQLNCEFASIKSWRAAVCGLSKCPKGKRCNFLHAFRNPGDEFDIQSPPRWTKRVEGEHSSRRSEQRNKSTWDDSPRSVRNDRHEWRWSESPETEVTSSGDRRKSSRRSTSSSRSSKSRRNEEKSVSKSRKRRNTMSEDESCRKSRRNHHESNKENGRDHRSPRGSRERRSRSKSRKKSKKSRLDKESALKRNDSPHSGVENENLVEKHSDRRDRDWDTTDSE